jgi:hypothetical protein
MTGAGDSRATPRHPRRKTGSDSSARTWWDWHLFGLWILVNGLAFVVIPLAGAAVEQLASLATRNLVQDNRGLVVLIIAVIGAVLQGLVVGSWQWRLLQRRVPDLQRRRWVMATLLPAFVVWLLVIAPEAADVLAKGGTTLLLFREGFIQALVLGPLIGLSQAAALRGHTSRWAWWFAANVTTYLSGAALHELGVWLKHVLSAPEPTTTFFPVVAFAIHGAWMLWVTAPQAASHQAPTAASRPLPHQPDARAVAAHPRQRRLGGHRDGAHRRAHHCRRLIMAAFGCFLIADILEPKEFGFALAAAVILDATLVRLLLVPAFMKVAGGTANWWRPHSLDRILPKVRLE